MNEQAQKKIFTKEHLLYFLKLNGGLFFVAAGIHFFKTPNHFAIGGTSGISILLSSLFPQLDVGVFMFFINAVLVAVGFLFLGKELIGATLYSGFALSFFVWVLDKVYPMTAPFTDDTLLELFFAIILPAAGSAIVFNIGASTGGTDIIAMILSKHSDLEIGKALFVSDFLITVAAGGLYGIKTGLYCVLGLLMKALLVDNVTESLNIRKMVTIVTTHKDEVLDFILNKLNRGATVHDAEGAYTHMHNPVIVTVLSRHQTVLLRAYLHQVDPHAFLTIVNSSETVGKGFRAL